MGGRTVLRDRASAALFTSRQLVCNTETRHSAVERLRRRHGVWYFRCRIPPELRRRRQLGEELTVSLRTRRADRLGAALAFIFSEGRSRRRAMPDGRSFDEWMRETVRRLAEEWTRDAEELRANRGPIGEEDLDDQAETLALLESDYRQALALSTVPDGILKRADELLEEDGREG